MSKCYFELRGNVTKGNINLAADMMRHLHARQYLGKTVVVCEHPAIFLTATHKQWHKLSRTIQKQRASSVNADKILKYTRTITHMQHMRFSAKPPLDDPDASVYFLCKDRLDALPERCHSIYLATTLDKTVATAVLAQLPADALIVDYAHAAPWKELDVAPKKSLEAQVTASWKAVQTFLSERRINVSTLFDGALQNVEAMDDALDTLLVHSHTFLQVADVFHHALELARPLRVSKALRDQYDAVALLAHRVQALSTSGYTQRFLETYNEDDTFFLYDAGRKYLRREALSGESLSAAVTRHVKAGRHHLAHALRKHALAH